MGATAAACIRNFSRFSPLPKINGQRDLERRRLVVCTNIGVGGAQSIRAHTHTLLSEREKHRERERMESLELYLHFACKHNNRREEKDADGGGNVMLLLSLLLLLSWSRRRISELLA